MPKTTERQRQYPAWLLDAIRSRWQQMDPAWLLDEIHSRRQQTDPGGPRRFVWNLSDEGDLEIGTGKGGRLAVVSAETFHPYYRAKAINGFTDTGLPRWRGFEVGEDCFRLMRKCEEHLLSLVGEKRE